MPPARKAHRRPPRERAEGLRHVDIIIATAVFAVARGYTIRPPFSRLQP
jgi:hypothetical protein